MSWSLENPVKTGAATLRAVSEHQSDLRTFGQRILGRGKKVPRAILLIRGGVVAAVDMTGRELTEKELNRQFPGVLEVLRDCT